MKNFKYIFIALVSISVLLTSCLKKEDPPMNHIPVGTVYTVEEVIAFGNGYVFDSAASMYATVTMDEANGNLNKIIYVQDSTAGISLTLPDNDSHLRQGDFLRINLNGLSLSDNNGMFTLKTVDAATNVIVISHGQMVEPKVVTITDITTGNYNAQIIQLVNVEFQDTTAKWSDAVGLSTQNRTLQDCYGNTIITRTSGYATFADEILPSGKGSLVAIAGVYGTTYQLYVRSLDEVSMDGERCNVYLESFAQGQGGFSIQDVELPSVASYIWSHDASYVCMKASCYIGNSDHAGESWLISPSFDFSRATVVELSFDHAINYLDDFAHVADFCSVMISVDYSNDNPNTATWEQLLPVYPNSGGWTFYNSGTIDISKYATNSNVHFAFKYKSIQGDAPTWEINNVNVLSD
ncbi:MAG: DUF5689 domain-containing protein [Bacteroidales bacterium]|nr:DUF5689 domain-containing protein [Bacteroidales bacterium]